MDLIRKILFYVEENYVAGGAEINIHIDGHLDSAIYEHCIFMKEDGVIVGLIDTSSLESKSCKVGNKRKRATVDNRDNKDDIYCNYYCGGRRCY